MTHSKARADAAPRRPHPYVLLREAFDVGRAMVVPAVVVGASMGGMRMGRMMLWGLIFLAASTLVFAIAEYVALRYRFTGDELILDSGVFRRRHRVIPVNRVHNLELRQNALQRALDVAEIRLETAGGDADEPVPLVLAKRDAEELRRDLLSAREEALRRAEAGPASEAELLAEMSARDLALAGATANEAGLLFALLLAGFELAYQLPVRLPWARLDPRVWMADLSLTAVLLLGFAVVLAFATLAWILSIAAAVVGYWAFVLERTGGELRKRYGSLNRREVTIPLVRVQALRVEESLMRRPLGLASLKIETAGGGPGEGAGGGAEAVLPLARVPELSHLTAAVFTDFGYERVRLDRVHPYAARRALIRYSLPILILTAAVSMLLGPPALWLLGLLPAAAVAARLHYRHLGYTVGPNHVVARSGFFNRITWIVPKRKIQTLHLVQTPFQRRWEVASVVVDTAAGQVRISDLGRGAARGLLESLTDQFEYRARDHRGNLCSLPAPVSERGA